MKSISLSDVEHAVRTIAETPIANENYFSGLAGTCGGGDFGTSLATGFRTVLGKWDSLDRSSIGPFLSTIGVVITGNVGGWTIMGNWLHARGCAFAGEGIDHLGRPRRHAAQLNGWNPSAGRCEPRRQDDSRRVRTN